MESARDRTTPANRFGVDYRAEAERFGTPPVPILDVHTHINGARAAEVYREVCELYGIRRTYSQSQISEAAGVKAVLGDMVRYIAIPSYMDDDKARAFREGFIENIHRWADEFGARCVKFWNAPRFRDIAAEHIEDPSDLVELDSPARQEVAALAVSKGMMFMTHVADPDTWFSTMYADAKRYGTKRDQYEPLERMLNLFPVPWIAAHMGGWPEDLNFLTGLLERNDNLLLDTSATKWMVRELSKHPRDALLAFLEKFHGRILFGSDIVTSDTHMDVSDPDDKRFGTHLANSRQEAFDLYAGRYWALRTMWESSYEGESNIADPDLMMVEPGKYDEMSAPGLQGFGVPSDLLRMLYSGAAEATIEAWYDRQGGW